MAYAIIARPGTEYGPCKEKCEHRDCAAVRKDAASLCTGCAKEIGYDKRWSTYAGKYWHSVCLEQAVEDRKLNDDGTLKS
jgi:hypothetical protein